MEMANFSLMEDDDYGDIFITQSSSVRNIVSLEENDAGEVLKDPKYSDISDDENNAMEVRIR